MQFQKQIDQNDQSMIDRTISSIPRQAIPYDSSISLWPNHNTKEAEVEQFYEDLQDPLEPTHMRTKKVTYSS